MLYTLPGDAKRVDAHGPTLTDTRTRARSMSANNIGRKPDSSLDAVAN